MATRIALLALLLAIVAVGIAVIGRPPETAAPSVSKSEVVALADRVATLERRVEELKARPVAPGDPVAAPMAALPTADAAPTDGPTALVQPESDVVALVEAAVEAKTREAVDKLEAKANRKPPIDLFASTLDLTDAQRRAVEREVVRAQGEILNLLDTPRADGGNFLDDLVGVFAKRIARPGEDAGWGRWVMGLTTQKVPGTDETYATRAEAVKTSLRAAFQRDLSEEQFAGFQSWGMDPTEIQGVPGSPYDDLGRRIRERARQLGADLPEEDGE